ncbi:MULTISPECIES: hypothetical protein [Methylobacterium]|uniref:Glycosyltransferase family 1 protein n=1 Tax=Methylobacterium thuringiense TaxID=1003091 RepID=A0ABQ4TKK2_9HYPH|nr:MULTISPECIES: hypothetical protein [Methylobacterium]TXN24610.1 hypothetical protein FV217_02140 [Methylobacterium sp. WL9]GJE55082.1 hypothetical protein EKPJFOCH_1569 [Methylobacterium thuringiense]
MTMIDTLHLLPPDLGPRSNPVLHGVAEAIAELFPPVVLTSPPREDGPRAFSAIESVDAPVEAIAAN